MFDLDYDQIRNNVVIVLMGDFPRLNLWSGGMLIVNPVRRYKNSCFWRLGLIVIFERKKLYCRNLYFFPENSEISATQWM